QHHLGGAKQAGAV
nr:Chain C, FIBRINOGEN GAMMA-CHAIN [Homo sapiens]2VR3_D Chain D, FIBRINOGEN GAMMA-CHAIN [Homo sapiens]